MKTVSTHSLATRTPRLAARRIRIIGAAIVATGLTLGAASARAQSTPPGWTLADIGGPASGDVLFLSGSVALASSGVDVDGTADHFSLLSRPITGDATVVAQINAPTGGDPWAKAGVMIRESSAAGARHGMAMVTRDGGVAFRYRTTTDAGTAEVNGGTTGAPVWLKLERRAATLTVFRSDDGLSWTAFGSTTVSMGASVLVGVGVASHVSGAGAVAIVSNMAVFGNGAGPAGWKARDIGAPALAGSVGNGGPTLIVDGAGTGIQGLSDQFRYVHKAIRGDADIVARVLGFTLGGPGARVGVMIRQSLTGPSAHAALLVSPATGVYFDRRGATRAGTVSTRSPSGAASTWLKLSRRGSTITAYTSVDGTTWSAAGAQALTLTDPVYVGLVATSTNPASLARATFDGLAVSAGNLPPTVSLVAPAAGARVPLGTEVTIEASAADADGTVARVDFYDGATLLGSDTTSPYTVAWRASAGTHILKAVATDNLGAAASSATRAVTAGTNASPTVSLTSPGVAATFSAPATITLAATASDADGRIVVVEFYRGATLLGSDMTRPYAFSWTAVPAGEYSITAVARDDGGATTVSSARDVAVVDTGVPTKVTFWPSPDHATVDRYVIDIYTSTSDPAIDPPVASRDLGRPAIVAGGITTWIGTLVSALPPGQYKATVSAINLEGIGRSYASAPFTR